jgi:hypothetical protein
MKNLTTFVLLLILCCNLSIAQNIDTTFKVTYKNNKILINNQSPYNLWLINQRDYIFDISDTSLTGQIISLSFANDANQNGIPNISA